MTAPVADDTDEGMQDAVSHALVRREPMELSSVAEIASAISQRDDDQILATMAGELITEFFYEFKIDNKLVEGISVTGANEFARIRADAGYPIRFPSGGIFAQEVTQNGELGIRIIVTARDCRSGADGIGMCFKPWTVERKIRDKAGRDTGRTKIVADNHVDRKCLSIAKRNAILSLLPEAQILVLLRERKKLIAVNEREQRSSLSAAPPVRATPALARSDDPYAETPSRRVPKPQQEVVTEEQTARLLDLISDVNVPERVRDKVEKGIEDGVSAKIAATWITSMEVHANPRAAAGAGDSADDLFGGAGSERKPVSAQSQGH